MKAKLFICASVLTLTAICGAHAQSPAGSAIPVTVELPAASTGVAAVFTDHVKMSHIIRKVLLRQIAITNDINPF